MARRTRNDIFFIAQWDQSVCLSFVNWHYNNVCVSLVHPTEHSYIFNRLSTARPRLYLHFWNSLSFRQFTLFCQHHQYSFLITTVHTLHPRSATQSLSVGLMHGQGRRPFLEARGNSAGVLYFRLKFVSSEIPSHLIENRVTTQDTASECWHIGLTIFRAHTLYKQVIFTCNYPFSQDRSTTS